MVIYERRRLLLISDEEEEEESGSSSESQRSSVRSWSVTDDGDQLIPPNQPDLNLEQEFEAVDMQNQITTTSYSQQDDDDANEALIKVVLIDREVFDCPICLDQLFTPVFQCDNGHITCSSCSSKLKSRCPFCCMPIRSRCRGLENFMESIKILCKYARNGCNKTTPYSNKIEHEQTCRHVTCYCPYPSCPRACSCDVLYLHFCLKHAFSITPFTYNTAFSISIETNQKQIFLEERGGSVVFILHHEVKEHGRALYVDFFGLTKFKHKFVYQLNAESKDTSLSFKSVPEVYKKLSKHTPVNLTVPSEFVGNNGILSLSVCINKNVSSELVVERRELSVYDHDTDEVLQVSLTNPDVLDCSICLKPLWTPVFQCENGHLACSSCCSKLKSKCSCCGYNYNRCRGLEKVIESMRGISLDDLKTLHDNKIEWF